MAKTKTAAKTRESNTSSETEEVEVQICRRRGDRRANGEAATADASSEPAERPTDADGKKLPERRKKVQRRRQIDPTTCERDYTNDEIEFMHALDAYKRANGRMFPTCSEILEVVRSIGYEKIDRLEEVLIDPDTGEEFALGSDAALNESSVSEEESLMGTASPIASPSVDSATGFEQLS